MGLVMRREMDFGPLGDMEPALRAQGVALAPISTGDASLSLGGVTVLPTATAADVAGGALKGLVVPGGGDDAKGEAAVRSLIDLARAQGAPVLAFGGAVALAAQAFGVEAAGPGAMFTASGVRPIADIDALAPAVAAIG